MSLCEIETAAVFTGVLGRQRQTAQMAFRTPTCNVAGLRTLVALALFSPLGIAAAEPQAEASSTPTTAAAPVETKQVEASVVKILATVRLPDFIRPWSKNSGREVSGTGVVIEGKRILTSAHVVRYASQVWVQPAQSGDKLEATVEAIAYGMDLAVLKVTDATFFDSHPALPAAKALPSVKDTVLAYGFPTGGTSVSITRGIVSRVEFSSYREGVQGLRVQVDAAINPGNSGGPAVVDDRMVGLAFARLGGAENIGYIVPCEEIDLFLQDIADGRYDGKPGIYDEFQPLENGALRSYLKLDKSVTGILVREPLYSTPEYPLKEMDVVTRIGGLPIDNDGMIKAGNGLRLRFAYLAQKVAKDGKVVPLTVIRQGKEISVELPTCPERPRLISDLDGTYPPYFVYGPVVFSAANAEIVTAFSSSTKIAAALSAVGSPLITRRGDKPSFPDEQLVIIPAPLFPHRLSKGYANPMARVVKSVNGAPVKNLAHLVELLRDCRDDYVVVRFGQAAAEMLVLPRTEAVAATEEILSDNGIREQASAELLKVWRAAPSATK
ncbi:serine protease [Opitutaceae bacterium EW11]|nr:serine protease [Opitutaceae bacterium EW11]